MRHKFNKKNRKIGIYFAFVFVLLFTLFLPNLVTAHSSGNPAYVRVVSADPQSRTYTFSCDMDPNNNYLRDFFIRPDSGDFNVGLPNEAESLDRAAGDDFTYTFETDGFYHVGCIIVDESDFSTLYRGDLHIDLRTSPWNPEIIPLSGNGLTVELRGEYSGSGTFSWEVIDAQTGEFTNLGTGETIQYTALGHGLYDFILHIDGKTVGLPIEFFDSGDPYFPDKFGVPDGVTNIRDGSPQPNTTYEAIPPIPTLDLLSITPSGNNWEFQIDTTNFEFFNSAPADMAPHVDGQGHIHWYLDGIKQGRIYSETFTTSLPSGTHAIKLTLSTNDHKEYTFNGDTISDSLTMDFSSPTDPPTTPPPILFGLTRIDTEGGLNSEFLCKPEGSSDDLVVDWNFGDGNFEYDVANINQNTYSAPGDYFVNCGVWDNTNLQFTSLGNFFTIEESTTTPPTNQTNQTDPPTTPPQNLFGLTRIDTEGGLNSEFLCKPEGSSDDLVVDWNFGDGNFEYDVANINQNTYSAPGDYFINCGVWDNTNLQFTSLGALFVIQETTNNTNQENLSTPIWLSHSGTIDISPTHFHLEVQEANNHILHASSDWEVLTLSNEVIWSFYNAPGSLRYHTHTPDGAFLGSLSSQDRLDYLTTYKARARFKDTNGTYTEWSLFREFTTAPQPTLNSTSPIWSTVPGFGVELFATGLDVPVQVAGAPQNLYQSVPESQRPFLYVTELYGKIKVIYKDGSSSIYAQNILNFDPFGSITDGGQMGLVGLYVDQTTGDLYVGTVYIDTTDNNTIKNKVIKFTTSTDGKTFTSQQAIIDNLPSSPSHQIQQITMNNGRLYVNIGDALTPSNAQDDSILAGKIISMNPDGSDVQIYAKGLRNPFGGDWSSSGVLYVTDNAPDTNDRLLKVTQNGNYGWGLNDNLQSFNANRIATLNVSPVDVEFNYDPAFSSSLFGRMYVAVAGPIFQQGATNGKEILEFQLDGSGNIISQRQFVRYTGNGYGTPIGLDFQEGALYFTDIYGEPGFIGLGQTEGNIYKVVEGGSSTNGTLGDFRAGISVIPWYPKDSGDGIEYIFECTGIDGSGNYLYDFYYGDGNKALNYASNKFYKKYPYGDTDYTVSCTVKDQTNLQEVSKSTIVNPSDFI